MNETHPARGRRRLLGVTAAALALILTAGCEDNNTVILDIGTTRLFPAGPGATGFRWQEIKQPELYVQAAKWEFVSAAFTYPGVTVDLAKTDDGTNCDLQASVEFRDSTQADPFGMSSCRFGVVIDELETAVPASLDVTFRLTVYRADPAELLQPRVPNASAIDYDGDGLLNDDDVCRIIAAPVFGGPQDISDCSFVTSAGGRRFHSDQDADLVEDAFDNCVWVPNTNQANTGGGLNSRGGNRVSDTLGIPDGIGDACTRQEAVSNDVTISFPATEFVQPRNVPTFVVLDFDFTGPGLACDWDAGTCAVDPSAVKFCTATDPSIGAFLGCP